MKHKISLLAIIVTIFVTQTSFSQSASSDEQAVKAVIEKLFKGMEKGDSAMARSVFAKAVTTATIYKDKSGNVVLRQENSIDDFMKAIGTPHKEVWYEEIWNLQVQLDGDFAQAWCDYAFYLDNKYSHCGVDAMHLYKDKGEWKMFHLADTRRKECNIPEEIKKKHQ